MRPPRRCAITPGDSIAAKTYATPPTACPGPSTRSSVSSLSTPFCSDTTAVSGPMAGRIAAAAVSVSNDFTQNSTTSAGGQAPARRSTASTLTVHSPSTDERTRSPSTLDRLQVRAAGQEGDRRRPARARLGAEVPAHSAGADDEHAHHHQPRCLK